MYLSVMFMLTLSPLSPVLIGASLLVGLLTSPVLIGASLLVGLLASPVLIRASLVPF